MLPILMKPELEEREERFFEKEIFEIPGQIGARGKYRILKKGLLKEEYQQLKKEDDFSVVMNGRHAFANFLPDDIRPHNIYVPTFGDE